MSPSSKTSSNLPDKRIAGYALGYLDPDVKKEEIVFEPEVHPASCDLVLHIRHWVIIDYPMLLFGDDLRNGEEGSRDVSDVNLHGKVDALIWLSLNVLPTAVVDGRIVRTVIVVPR